MTHADLAFKNVTNRTGRKVPYDYNKIQKAISRAILALERRPGENFEKETDRISWTLTKEVVAQLQKRCFVEQIESPHVELIQDTVLDTLHREMSKGAQSRLADPERVWMGYMIYREGRRFVREGRITQKEFDNQTRLLEKVAELRAWNAEYGCDTIAGLNEWFTGNHANALIRISEDRKTGELHDVAEYLERVMHEREVRAIIITGPSSSGKTTTTRRSTQFLAQLKPGTAFKPIEVDMYFKPNSAHEEVSYDVDGTKAKDLNFELPSSYDIELFNDHLERLMRGETVLMPKYDFASGTRKDDQTPFSLGRHEVLLIDCMHALSPELTQAIPRDNKVKVYIEAMNMLEDGKGEYLRWTDLRLMRRMLRDVRTRGHAIEKTVRHWHLVRKGERFIFPYISSADLIINGGLPYEVPILKHYLDGILKDIKPVFDRNRDLFDGKARVQRILGLLSQLHGASEKQIESVPKNSILREFIGGSEFF